MASLGRVQSPRMRTTLGLSRRALTASLSSTSFLFTWQVMHHSAVTSTKTTCPPATSPAMAVASSGRSEEHTSELQSLMRISYAVFCLKKKNKQYKHTERRQTQAQSM